MVAVGAMAGCDGPIGVAMAGWPCDGADNRANKGAHSSYLGYP